MQPNKQSNMKSQITKEEQLMFPKTFTTRVFKEYSDNRDAVNEIHSFETVVENRLQEIRFFENINHEANIVIEVKLPNGVIK